MRRRHLDKYDGVTAPELKELVLKIASRLRRDASMKDYNLDDALDYLNKLTEFALGRYLIKYRSLNGFWTHHVLTYRDGGELENDFEHYLLTRTPIILATQERFKHFLSENQKAAENARALSSMPSGLMAELLYLDYRELDQVELWGFDIDPESIELAANLAESRGLAARTKLQQKDVWKLNVQEKFDLISSNGLNVYVADDEKLRSLYKVFFDALRPRGKLVTSFLTYPPGMGPDSEWRQSEINPDDLYIQKTVFGEILQANWQCYRTTQETEAFLTEAGFVDIRYLPDRANMFPTVIAKRP